MLIENLDLKNPAHIDYIIHEITKRGFINPQVYKKIMLELFDDLINNIPK